MTEAWVNRYLDRIKYHGDREPTAANLANMQQAHVYAVPFEDLDIHYGVKLSLNHKDLYRKIIDNNRGGFCYELNYLFGTLLRALGFEVTFISARVYNESTGVLGPEYDHMALLVTLDQSWLADVGFGGRAFIRPLQMLATRPQQDPAGFYRIEYKDQRQFQVLRSMDRKEFQPLYNFSLTSQNIESFYQECLWKQTDQKSHFVKNKICTLATPTGRKSILNSVFSIREGDNKLSTEISSQQHEMRLLKEHFNIQL